DVAVQTEARAAAGRERDAILPRIPRLRVELKGATATGVRIRLDARPLDPALLGVEFGINPGAHAIDVEGSRDATTLVHRSFTLSEKEHQGIVLELPAVAKIDKPPASAGAAPASRAGSVRRTAAIAFAGVGVAETAVGFVFAGLASSKWSLAREA